MQPPTTLADQKLGQWVAQHFFGTLVLVVVVVLLLGFLLFLRPEIKRGNSFSQDVIKRLTADIKASELLIQQIDAFRDKFTATTPTAMLDKLNEVLPPTSQIPNLIINLEAVAEVSGLQIRNLNITEVPAAGQGDSQQTEIPQQVMIKMDLTGGGYNAFKSFLIALERNVRLFDVEDLSFDPTKDSFSIRGAAYYVER